MQRYTVYLETALNVSGGTIHHQERKNCNYNIWFECAVGGLRRPQHTQTNSNSSTIAAGSSNGVTITRCYRYSCLRSWWWVMVTPETCRAVSR